MMRLNRLLLLLLFCPFLSWAQSGTISGTVSRLDTKTALGNVSIFLSNSSFGTSSAANGTFTLSGIKPGQYELVATSVGFEDFNQTVMVGKDPIKVTIELLPKVTQLREVVITTNADWKKNYAIFEKEFIGTSANAKKCKVINPHVLTFIYHSKKQTLDAWGDEFLVVENHALGYRVKFLLKNFSYDKLQGMTSWEGQVLFEELPAGDLQKKEWKQKREDCYFGSSRHFLRALYAGKATEDGFVIRHLNRKLNVNRPRDEEIDKKIKYFKQSYRRDSLIYWNSLFNMPKYIDNLDKLPIEQSQVFRRLKQPNLFAITFENYLYVIYTKRHEDVDFKDVYHPLDMENFETSVITLFKQNYAVFDRNGSFVMSPIPLFEGTWAKAKLAELLPLDYEPGD